MKVFGRYSAALWQRGFELPKYIWYLCKCLLLFKQPLQFIRAYFSMCSLPERVVDLRNGMKIHLSEHPHDIITVFVIFVREDYGDIVPGSTVVDIGANIGVYSLYAINRKAAKVLAYEPNSESYQYLRKNIEANGLEGVISSHQFAVTSVDGEVVKFPTKASMYNAIIAGEEEVDHELVETISLPTILNTAQKTHILKLDCEGAEYDILFNLGRTTLTQVDSIRLEYHLGQLDKLGATLQLLGFVQVHLKADAPTAGNVWYRKV